jgi:hypothetical protein
MMGYSSSQSYEPSLEEIFAEPIVQLLMKRDGIHAREMQHELHRSQFRTPHSTPRF